MALTTIFGKPTLRQMRIERQARLEQLRMRDLLSDETSMQRCRVHHAHDAQAEPEYDRRSERVESVDELVAAGYSSFAAGAMHILFLSPQHHHACIFAYSPEVASRLLELSWAPRETFDDFVRNLATHCRVLDRLHARTAGFEADEIALSYFDALRQAPLPRAYGIALKELREPAREPKAPLFNAWARRELPLPSSSSFFAEHVVVRIYSRGRLVETDDSGLDMQALANDAMGPRSVMVSLDALSFGQNLLDGSYRNGSPADLARKERLERFDIKYR